MEEIKERAIKSIVLGWLDNKGWSQKELADRLRMSAPSAYCMLKGNTPLPLLRLLQIIHILSPSQKEVNDAFGIYLDDLDIPRTALCLTVQGGEPVSDGGIRARIHELIDLIPDEKLSALEPVLSFMVEQK